jgi:hypothetical protein
VYCPGVEGESCGLEVGQQLCFERAFGPVVVAVRTESASTSLANLSFESSNTGVAAVGTTGCRGACSGFGCTIDPVCPVEPDEVWVEVQGEAVGTAMLRALDSSNTLVDEVRVQIRPDAGFCLADAGPDG